MINDKDLLTRITVDPKVMVGKPVIRGMRITVDQILRVLAAGISIDEIIDDYPDLEKEDIHAILLYAAELVSKEQVFQIGVTIWMTRF